MGDAQIITLLNFDMGSGSGIDSYLPIIFSYILLDSFDANLNEIISSPYYDNANPTPDREGTEITKDEKL